MRGQPVIDSKRERTRRAVVQAAMKRFADQGVAATTIDEIVADVGITKRSFYRYFATKEEVLFADYQDRVGWFRTALAVRPRSEPLSLSVRYAMESFPPDDHRLVGELARLRSTELTDEQAAVYLQRVQGMFAREIEDHLRATTFTAPDTALQAATIAAILSAAVFAAMTHWSRDPHADPDSFGPLVETALGIADAGIDRSLRDR